MFDVSLRNRSIFLFLTFSLLFFLAMAGLQFSYYPQKGRKVLSLSIEMRGVWQDQIENLITNPLEEKLLGMKDVNGMVSRSEDEKAVLTLFLDDNADLGHSYLELRDILDRMDFPEGTQKPQISKNDSNALPVFILQVEDEWTEIEVKSLLKQVKGVGQIEISGIPKQDVIIHTRQDDLHSLQLSNSGMARIFGSANVLGSIPVQGQTSLILDLRYAAVNHFNSQQLAEGLTVEDVFKASLINTEQKSLSRVNGEEKVLIWIKESGDANTISLCRDLRRIRSRLGETRILYDKGMLTEEALKEILYILLFSLISVTGITLLVLSSLKTSLLLCLNIPFSLSGTLALFRILGWEVDILVLAGLALSTGMIIDSGVLYLESGAKAAARPVFFSLFSTLLVFSSFLFAPYEVKVQNSGLIGSLCFSLTLSVFFIMVIMQGILQNPGPQKSRIGLRFLDKAFSMFLKIRCVTAAGLLILLILCLYLLQDYSVTQDFRLPDPSFRFSIEYPAGRSREKIIRELDFFEKELTGWKEPDFFTSEYRDEKASFHIRLRDEKDRKQLRVRVNQSLEGTGGYIYFQDSNREKESTIKLNGQDRAILYEYSGILTNALHRSTGYTVVQHYKKQPNQLMLTPRKEKLEAGSLSPGEMVSALEAQLNRPVLGKWFPPELSRMPQSVYDIRIFDPAFLVPCLQELKDFRTSPDRPETLETLAMFEDKKDYGYITHEDALRSLSFSIQDSGQPRRNQTGKLLRSIEKVLIQYPLPEGVRIKYGEIEKEQSDYERGLIKSLIISLTLIFLLLLFLYESLFLPVYLFLQILFCHLFSLGILKLAGFPLSSPVFFALVLNTGLLINNGLVIFGDYSKGKPAYSEVVNSVKNCGVSLFTAAVTTLGGLIPLLFRSSGSGGMLPALSLTVSSGILFSLFLQLVTIPLMFRNPGA